MVAIAVTRTDLSASDLRAAAKRAVQTKQARRILAIAMVLDGYRREDAAQACAWIVRRCVIGCTATTRRGSLGLPIAHVAAGPAA